MKRKLTLLLSLILLISGLFPTASVFAQDPPSNKILIEGDDLTYFELHPAIYDKWGKDYNYGPGAFDISGKRLKDNDPALEKFKESRRSETSQLPVGEESWYAYEIHANTTLYPTFGQFMIESLNNTLNDTYLIWPEQLKMYISYYDEDTKSFTDPIKMKSAKFGDDYKGPSYYILKDEDPKSHKYRVLTSLTKYRKYGNFQNNNIFRLFVYQGLPKEIPHDLTPGIYKVPLSIRVSTGPGEYSMAGGAVKPEGKLIVKKGEPYKLQFSFQPMVVSDPSFTGDPEGKPVTGHLLKLWEYPTVDAYNEFLENETFYSANQRELTPITKYKDYGVSFPETYEVPLVDMEGNPNYEGQKIFKVKVDAMGSNMPQFNMLLHVDNLKLESLALDDGIFKGIILDDNESLSHWNSTTEKVDLTDEQFQSGFPEGNYINEQFTKPFYDVQVRDNKVDLTITTMNNPEEGLESRLVPMDSAKPIRYKKADGSLATINILEETDFVTGTGLNGKYGKRITKFQLKDVPLGRSGSDDAVINLENGNMIFVEGDESSLNMLPHYGKFLPLKNVDLSRMEKVGEVEIPPHEKALKDKIGEANGMSQGRKSDEAFQALKDAIAVAQKVYDAYGDEASYTKGIADLNAAIEAFNNSPDQEVDKTALNNTIAEAEKLDTTNKTEESVKVLKDALAKAKAIQGNADATEDEVQNANTSLQNAINNLKDKPKPPSPTPTEPLDYKNLKDGQYSVDLKVKKKVGNSLSMADGAVNKPATIVVEDGKYYLQIVMKPIEQKFGGQDFKGYLGDMHYLTPSGDYQRVEIIDYYDEKDDFYPQLVNYYEKNYPDVPKEDIKYPKTLRYPVEKPTGEEQETSTQVFIPVMEGLMTGAGTQKCKPTIFWNTLEDPNAPNPDTPKPDQPKPPVTPGAPTGADKSQLFREIQDSLNLAYNEYTRESWNAFNQALTTAVVLNQQPYATQKEVDEAATILRAKRQSLVKESTSQPGSPSAPITPSNPGNTNQPITPGTETPSNINTYEVPVEVLKAYDSGYSMANNAINHTATVIEQNGTYTYYVQFVPMEKEFGGQNFVGNLTKLFVYQPSKTVASSYANNVWAFTRNQKDSKVKVAVWVDAMDEIAGGTPGAGEQDAILSFDWSKAKLVSKGKAEAPEFKPAPPVEPKVEEKKPTTERKEPVTSTFTDIVNHWAKTAIEYVVEKGYFKGTSTTTFTPNRGITRGEFVTVLGRIAKVDTGQYTGSNFKDVKGDTFYAPYVNWAESLGVVKGTGQNAFEPNRTLTREEMAVIMARYLKTFNVKLKETETTTFNDGGSIAPWAKDAVNEMAKQGVIKGMEDGNFSPKTNFTRAQVAQVLYNIDHK